MTIQWVYPISSMLWTTAVVVLAIRVTINLIKYYRLLPPGPWGLPIVGYLPWMWNSAPHTTYLKLAEQYGNVTSLQLGKDLVVFLGSADLVRDYFNRADSTGRPHTPLNNLMEGRGVILSEGNLWKKQRQFLQRSFQSLGVSLNTKPKLETIIINEIEEMIIELRRGRGAAVDAADALGRHVHNVVCRLNMSYRFKKGDPNFTEFNERINEGMRLFGEIHAGEHLPSYFLLPGKAEVVKKIKKNLKGIINFHVGHIEERQRERSKTKQKGTSEDLLDLYLDEIFETKNKSSVFPGCTDSDAEVKQMIQVMNDLFSAGVETTRTTLAWLLVMMVREPTAAAAVCTELASVVSPGTLVTLKHRSQLVFLQSVIFETLRRVSVVPLGTTHVNETKWKIGDYVVPKGTHIVPLINKIHMDPIKFPDPESFKPERFLKDGHLEISESFLAFGAGRRVCLGQQLARMELILFLANIMNNFTFSLAEGEDVPSLDGVFGITHAPKPYRLCFKPINNFK